MTPEQIAAELTPLPSDLQERVNRVVAVCRRAIAEAVAEEREACARIVESLDVREDRLAKIAARDIRARGNA